MRQHVSKILLFAGFTAALTWVAEQVVDPEAPRGERQRAAVARRTLPTRTAAAAGPAPAPDEVWVPRQLRLAPAPGVDAAALARAHGLTLLRPPGAAGEALVELPAAGEVDAVIAALQADPDVAGVGRNGRTAGASTAALPSLRPSQWHLSMLGVDDSAAVRAANATVTVAVVDSGVAYADGVEGGQSFARAESLAQTVVLAPYDFVDDDAQPFDLHMHGTHVATTILGAGRIAGVAPGAALMPLRVLDANNQGGELDLIEAIHWAVDNGADIINLSLSFAAGYTPSLSLQRALERARAAGVVVLAASGNSAGDEVSWPAASPHVVAVGASRPEAGWAQLGTVGANASTTVSVAPYTSVGTAMGVIAPGGDLTRDLTGDGFPDGILAEAPRPGAPGELGYYFMAGTSQAAAVASGVAARLLAEGVAPADLPAAINRGGVRFGDGTLPLRGLGGGYLHLGKALWALDQPQLLDPVLYATGIGAMHKVTGTKVAPAVLVRVQDKAGAPVAGVDVVVRIFDGSTLERPTCRTGADGSCVARGAERPDRSSGVTLPYSFVYQVARVVSPGGDGVRPLSMFFGSDALEAIVRSAGANPSVPANMMLALRMSQEPVPSIGTVQAGVLLPYLGTGLSTSPLGLAPLRLNGGLSTLDGSGLSTSPMGVFINQAALTQYLSGSGLSTSPLGRAGVSLVTEQAVQLNLDGQGLSTSPLGLLPAQLVNFTATQGTNSFLVIDGSGLSTSPLGFSGGQLFKPGGSLTDLSGVSLDGGVPVLSVADGYGPLEGTALGVRVEEGGFTTAGFNVIVGAADGGVAVGASAGSGAAVALE